MPAVFIKGRMVRLTENRPLLGILSWPNIEGDEIQRFKKKLLAEENVSKQLE